MKVLHVFQEYLGVSESWAYNLLNSFSESEIYIGAIYYNEDNKEYFNPNFKFLATESTADIRKLYKNPSNLSLMSRIFLRTKRKFLKDEIVSIHKWVNSQNPDLIHVHFASTAVHFQKLLLNLSVPFVVSFYGYDYRQYTSLNPNAEKVYTNLLQKASHVFVEGSNGFILLDKIKFNKNKVKVFHLGVDTKRIKYRICDTNNSLKMIQMANFKEKKGQLTLVKALTLIPPKTLKQVSLTFVGDSDNNYGQNVKEFVKGNSLDKFVKFESSIKYDKIHQKLSNYDIFVHPSQFAEDGDCEGGAPTILLDAQAVGLPIIATRHCDIPEYVCESANEYLVEEGNYSELAQTISDFCHMDKNKLKGLSIKGRKHVERNYDIKQNAIRMEKYYLQLLENNLD